MKLSCPLCASEQTYEYVRIKSMPTLLHAVSQRDLNIIESQDFVARFCPDCLVGYNALPLKLDDYRSIYEHYSIASPMSGLGREKYYGIIKAVNKYCNRQETIVDIGCYDGYLLSTLKNNGFSNLLGIEPSQASKIALSNGLNVINDFFREGIDLHDVDCFILSHVYEHFSDPIGIMRLIKHFMKRICLIEVPYFSSYLHEHLFFFSLFSIKKICDIVGLHIIDFEIDDYFGSNSVIRVVIGVEEVRASKEKVQAFIAQEMQSIPNYAELNQKSHDEEVERLKRIVSDEQVTNIAFWGAGSACVVFLNCIHDLLGQVNKNIVIIDGDNNKHGKYIPGVKLKVESYKDYTNYEFDAVVILSMFYREIMSTIAENKIIAKNTYVFY